MASILGELYLPVEVYKCVEGNYSSSPYLANETSCMRVGGFLESGITPSNK